MSGLSVASTTLTPLLRHVHLGSKAYELSMMNCAVNTTACDLTGNSMFRG